jgi:hypothetical protein
LDDVNLIHLQPITVDIPKLDPDFFQSEYFKQFQLQRTFPPSRVDTRLQLALGPILDPDEYSSRYLKYYAGNEGFLGPEGKLLAIILVIWAISFGVDESGKPLPPAVLDSASSRKERCNKALSQVFQYIDQHGIMRRASWDGVRALLLLFPLTEGLYLSSAVFD